MKRTSRSGADILAGSRAPLLQMAERIALTHHEWWDGSGYLDGLRGDEIPLAGRIVAIADVFDALTHDRPYKRACPSRGTRRDPRPARPQFDPASWTRSTRSRTNSCRTWRRRAPHGRTARRSEEVPGRRCGRRDRRSGARAQTAGEQRRERRRCA